MHVFARRVAILMPYLVNVNVHVFARQGGYFDVLVDQYEYACVCVCVKASVSKGFLGRLVCENFCVQKLLHVKAFVS